MDESAARMNETGGEAREDGLGDLPKVVTIPGQAFCRQFISDLLHVAGTEMLANEFERFATGVAEVLAYGSETPSQAIIDKAKPARAIARRNWPVTREVACQRFVDNYLVYIAELIGTLFRSRPEALRSAQTKVSVEQVLRHDSIDDFVEWLADDTVNRLSYDGFGSIADFFEGKFGMPLVADEEVRRSLVEAIAIRNLLTHRRGVVDERFVTMLASEGLNTERYVVGERLDPLRHVDSMLAAQRAMADVDARVVLKFGLATVPLDASGWQASHEDLDAAVDLSD